MCKSRNQPRNLVLFARGRDATFVVDREKRSWLAWNFTMKVYQVEHVDPIELEKAAESEQRLEEVTYPDKPNLVRRAIYPRRSGPVMPDPRQRCVDDVHP